MGDDTPGLTQEQREQRHVVIGSSDAAPTLGLSRFRSMLDVYLEKRGAVTDMAGLDNEPTIYWGHRLEIPILEEYKRRRGVELMVKPPMIRSVPLPFMGANLDALRYDNVVVEAKTARTADGWGEEETDDVPAEYLVQVTHQMIVAGADLAELAVLIGGSDFRIYKIKRDREFSDYVIDAERDMWRRIEEGDPPSPQTMEDIRKLYPRSTAKSIEADEETRRWVTVLLAERKIVAGASDAVEEAKVAITAYMGDCELLTIDRAPVISFRAGKDRKSIDVDLLRTKYPSTAELVEKLTPASRRFLVKGEK